MDCLSLIDRVCSFFFDIRRTSLKAMRRHPLLLLDCIDGAWSSFRIITLREAAINVLNEGDILQKAKLTFYYVDNWKNGIIKEISNSSADRLRVPDSPRRPDSTSIPTSKPKSMSRNAIEISVHGIAHAESYAIDLFWDCIARFVHYDMPREFYDDLVHIAGQEASHFMSWFERLERFGCPYGSLATHDGLWRSAAGYNYNNYNNNYYYNLYHI